MLKRFKAYLKEKNFFDSPKKRLLSFVAGAAVVCVVYTGASYKEVKILVDGKETTTSTFKWTVQGVLEQNNIVLTPKDKVEPAIDQSLKKGDCINVTKAKEVTLLVDGKEKKLQTADSSVEQLLNAEKVVLNNKDRVKPLKDTKIADGLKVEVTRVEEKSTTVTEDIDYKTVVKENSNLSKSVKKVVQKGEKGKKEVVSKTVYENDKALTEAIVSEKVVQEPKDEIIEKGTKEDTINNSSNNNSSNNNSSNNNSSNNTGGQKGNLKYKKKMTMTATAYYTGTVTATGTRPVRNPGGYSTIAVDPKVIPLGSKVYIDGYGYAIAADTGGVVKNNIIDLFMNSRSECLSWGRRKVTLYVL